MNLFENKFRRNIGFLEKRLHIPHQRNELGPLRIAEKF